MDLIPVFALQTAKKYAAPKNALAQN